jgi:hypothetical protein
MPILIQNASTGRRFAAWAQGPSGSVDAARFVGRETFPENGTFGAIPFVCRVCDSSFANNSAALAANLKKLAVVVV